MSSIHRLSSVDNWTGFRDKATVRALVARTQQDSSPALQVNSLLLAKLTTLLILSGVELEFISDLPKDSHGVETKLRVLIHTLSGPGDNHGRQRLVTALPILVEIPIGERMRDKQNQKNRENNNGYEAHITGSLAHWIENEPKDILVSSPKITSMAVEVGPHPLV